ncbi:nuclear cap-binding protein subunit 3-like isoform X1 [Ischnura elegans]|uniref:nuclear cap-binding protein subunit 3-like isoform X1 n=1 Tax=Ischnura elegans TaxID=197161 RepID=UPI001ED89D41|nr:nuclear cap-binding protein subunit 3-like isoform X1 [Ischnura elegans]
MALTKDEHELPNLKIEIENDLEEAMDTDDGEVNKLNTIVHHGRAKDVEEGEVCDVKDDTQAEPRIVKTSDTLPKTKTLPTRETRNDGNEEVLVPAVSSFNNKNGDGFSQKTRKYGLSPEELQAITEDKLASLYESLGMKDEESTEKRYRLDALHMRGTQDMSTDDVFAYFKDCSPASIEWINDYSCNVVWMNNVQAAKAIVEMTRPIKGLENSHPKDPFAEDRVLPESKRRRLSSENVVVMVTEVEDQDNEVLMVGDDDPGEEEASKAKESQEKSTSPNVDEVGGDNFKSDDSQAANASEIDIPIPPGLWRLGKPTPKAKHILLRYALKTDRKPARAEKMSDYYKKHGNPNYGGIKGLITKSRKRRFREKANMDAKPLKGNPWGSLAETWGDIDRRKAMLPEAFDRDGEIPLTFSNSAPHVQRPIQMYPLARSSVSAKTIMPRVSRPLPQRKGLSSDPESDKSSDDEDGSSTSQWRRKIKQPRMRMYADEEEKRVERRRELQKREAEVAAAVYSGMDLKSVTRGGGGLREDGVSKRQIGDLRSRLSKDRGDTMKRGGVAVNTVNRPSRGASSVWNRLAQREKALMDAEDDEDEEEVEEDEEEAIRGGSEVRSSKSLDLRASLTKKPFEGDLRSKLNRSKTLKNSPLRIEIDNDEYYRVTGCD